MFTIDASVWINRFDPREGDHEISRQLIELLTTFNVPVIVPNLVFIEIAGAISRRHNDPDGAQRFANSVRGLSNLIVIELDDELAQQALTLAAQQRLRGADAIYAAVAIQQTCFLISLDNEHLTRLVGVVETRTPTALMAELTPSQEPGE